MRQGLDQPRGPPRVPGRREALASWPRPTHPHSRAVACSALLGTCGHRSGFRLRAGPPTRHPWLPRSRPGSATLLPGGLLVLQHLVLATSPDAETVTASLSRSVVASPGAVPSRGGMRGTCFLCGTEATPYLSVDGGWWVTLDLYGDRADVLTVVLTRAPAFPRECASLGVGRRWAGRGVGRGSGRPPVHLGRGAWEQSQLAFRGEPWGQRPQASSEMAITVLAPQGAAVSLPSTHLPDTARCPTFPMTSGLSGLAEGSRAGRGRSQAVTCWD